MAEEQKQSPEIELLPYEELEMEWMEQQAPTSSPASEQNEPVNSPIHDDIRDTNAESDCSAYGLAINTKSTDTESTDMESTHSESDEDEGLAKLVEAQKGILRLLQENADVRAALELMFKDK